MRILDYFEASGSNTHTISNGQPNSIMISNDSSSSITASFANQSITVKAGEVIELSTVIPFYEVDITADGEYRLFIGE